jgi:hypothetical protein
MIKKFMMLFPTDIPFVCIKHIKSYLHSNIFNNIFILTKEEEDYYDNYKINFKNRHKNRSFTL